MNEPLLLSIADVLDEEAKAIDSDPCLQSDNTSNESRDRIGLALSGGGIRSATFSLGVLQSLAAHRRLASFDYLSTVSGGGYIGSWLSAWIHRRGLAEVQEELGRFWNAEKRGAPAAGEPPEVTWLRRYSSYLAPRMGLMSLDSLTLITTWSRNFLLNLVVLLGFLACLFISPYLLLDLFEWSAARHSAFGFAAAWTGLLFFLGIAYNLWHQGLPIQRRRNWLISTRGVGATVIVPGVCAACFGAVWLVSDTKKFSDAISSAYLLAVLLGALLLIWATAEGIKRKSWSVLRELPVYCVAAGIALAVSTAILAALYLAWTEWVPKDPTTHLVILVALGPSALLLAFGVGTTVFTGMVGRNFFERSREWWSRLNAWLLALGVGWAVWCLLTFFALPALLWLASKLGAWLSLLGTGWLASLFAAIYLHQPESASKRLQLHVDRALNSAAAIFIAGLLFVVAASIQWALLAQGNALIDPERGVAVPATTTFEVYGANDTLALKVGTPERRFSSLEDRVRANLKGLRLLRSYSEARSGWTLPQLALGVVALVTLLFGWRVDINKFSLHNMYKNRLIRCYLGASNRGSRNEQPFTGLDDGDDVPLRDLATPPESARRHFANHASEAGQACDSAIPPAAQEPLVQRPLHLINVTLNITQGNNLAWQERKAAAFTFSPLHCGYSLARTQGDSTPIDSGSDWATRGYRPTYWYATKDREEKGFTMGMALATSGAAVSPHMGYASRPVRAFVLTMFNVRLGRWSSNPAGAGWKRPSPRFGLISLLQELFGISNEEREYVYLSDGGHFDNLGVYELVRRRCRVIFSVDAGADPSRALRDLADTIRKCRIDMGVEIEFSDLNPLHGESQTQGDAGFSKGAIRYDPNDRSKDGTLIVIKPTMGSAREEPVDLLHYAAQNKPFPQQTTADQVFDESQFESYRRLGAFLADKCIEKYGLLLPEVRARAKRNCNNSQSAEVPAGVSKLVFRLLPSRWRVKSVPPRDGSLIDFCLAFTCISLLLWLAFVVLDNLLIGARPVWCLTTADCEAGVRELLSGGAGGIGGRKILMLRTLLDNVFVVSYTAAFVSGVVIGTSTLGDPSARKTLRLILVGLVLLLAVFDYSENFVFLGAVSSAAAIDTLGGQVALLTSWKLLLFTACISVFLCFVPKLRMDFLNRWRANEQ